MNHIHTSLSTDPLGVYPNATPEQIIEAAGLVPMWVLDVTGFETPLQEWLNECYQFGMYEMEGSVIQEDGTYVSKYAEDPDMLPILMIHRGDEIFYQYQHGVVAIINAAGESFVTRMD